MSFGDHLDAVFGRYDSVVMRPPPRPDQPVSSASWAILRTWCLDGAGPGGTTFWRPGGLPAVQRRLAMGQWLGPDSVALAFALNLDGSDSLAAMHGRSLQVKLRLQTKIDDACWWRRRYAQDPWDAGLLVDGEAALHRLQKSFMPRRATLLIAGAMDAVHLSACVSALQQRSPQFRHPVRLLCLADAPTEALQGATDMVRMQPSES